MKAFCLVHCTLFEPLFGELVTHDNVGFLLLERDSVVDVEHPFPRSIQELTPVILLLEPSGKIVIHTDRFNLGKQALNSKLLSSPDVRKIQYDQFESVVRIQKNVGSLVSYFETKAKTFSLGDYLVQWLEAHGLNQYVYPEHHLVVQNMYRDSVTVSLLKRLFSDTITIETRKDERFPTGYRVSQEDHEGKGELGGRCNVNACQLPGTAFFYNMGTRAYYCYHCALTIHKANRDMYKEYGPLFLKDLIADARNSGELKVEAILGQVEVLKLAHENI